MICLKEATVTLRKKKIIQNHIELIIWSKKQMTQFAFFVLFNLVTSGQIHL